MSASSLATDGWLGEGGAAIIHSEINAVITVEDQIVGVIAEEP